MFISKKKKWNVLHLHVIRSVTQFVNPVFYYLFKCRKFKNVFVSIVFFLLQI